MSSPFVLAASTFVEVLVLLFIFIPLVLLWVFALVDIFGRPDISGWAKAAWLLLIIIIPIIGALVYIGTRPSDVVQDVRATERRP
jgi:hypothetical protein